MNVKQFIQIIKKRPQMYIGDPLNMDYLYHYIGGFMTCNILNSKDEVDILFSKCFHGWVRQYLEKEYELNFENKAGNYLFYIKSICTDDKQCIEMFFSLAEAFFEEQKI